MQIANTRFGLTSRSNRASNQLPHTIIQIQSLLNTLFPNERDEFLVKQEADTKTRVVLRVNQADIFDRTEFASDWDEPKMRANILGDIMGKTLDALSPQSSQILK